MSINQTLDCGYHFEKLHHNQIENLTSLASAIESASGKSWRTKTVEDTWFLFIEILAKEVQGIKPNGLNTSVITSDWFQQSKRILMRVIEENQYIDILGQFEHEYLLRNLAAYDKYYLACSQVVESFSKEYLGEKIKLNGKFNFCNTNAGTGITILRLARKFLEFGLDVQNLYAECYELNPHLYNLCLIQLHFSKINFSIKLVKSYEQINIEESDEPEPELFDMIMGDFNTKKIVGFHRYK